MAEVFFGWGGGCGRLCEAEAAREGESERCGEENSLHECCSLSRLRVPLSVGNRRRFVEKVAVPVAKVGEILTRRVRCLQENDEF